jgi:hypothetical protein
MIKLPEYAVDPVVLKIRLDKEVLELDSNGYNYYGEMKYFEKDIGPGSKL